MADALLPSGTRTAGWGSVLLPGLDLCSERVQDCEICLELNQKVGCFCKGKKRWGQLRENMGGSSSCSLGWRA